MSCADLEPNLAEARLFGYVAGAYTGAGRGDVGCFRAADDGTLLLDEILELTPAVQAKLLRALQTRKVMPLGTSRPQPFSARLLAASQRRLDEVVAAGSFREDLQVRLEQHVVELPSLAERREDLGLLIAAILPKYGVTDSQTLRLSSRAVALMMRQPWRGNVRKLENALVQALRHQRDGVLSSAAFRLPEGTEARDSRASAELPEGQRALKARIVTLLEKHGGNASAVAREMSKHKQQVSRWIRRLNIDPRAFQRR